ncbi:MAG TPA: dUTP diphosphatase, partial [Acidimicrobiales bacterium]|nr:dUTP diphosphatase [Acidimicrobiales bacterium]
MSTAGDGVGGVSELAAGAVQVPVLRLDAELPLLTYARDGDAGADLVARSGVTLAAGGGRATVPTGIALALPPGYAGFVQPRSGLALRHGVTCLNTPGLIDSGYRD